MFDMQLPSYAELQVPNCDEENQKSLEEISDTCCFRRNFRYLLTPFQVVSNSNSKVFGVLNLFQCLLMQ